jgi:hypothetical protein
VIRASIAVLLASAVLLAVGLASGSVPVLLATVAVACAALVPLTVAVVRARPRVSAAASRPGEQATGPADRTPGADPPPA